MPAKDLRLRIIASLVILKFFGAMEMSRETPEHLKHESLINMMLDFFKDQGYVFIKADLKGKNVPSLIESYVPDLTCLKNDPRRTLIILEAETCGTIFHKHTEGQWKAFHRKASNEKGEFHIVVPKKCNNDSGDSLVRQRLSKLGIKATIWIPSI